MNLSIAILTVILLAVVIAVISAPLRTIRARDTEPAGHAELEAARESKYREIRDAELDYRTGKLSHEDFQMVNDTLRGEAIKILDALQALEDEQTDQSSSDGPVASDEDRGGGPAELTDREA
jgi:hypothetical protein